MRLLACSIFALTLSAARLPQERFANLPLAIEPGANASEFVAHAAGHTLRITANQASLGERRMSLAGANPAAQAIPEQRLPGESHYLLGNDPRSWRRHVPHYARLRYHNVYPGIDVVYYGSGRTLEFDFVVAPGADPGRIRLTFEGGLRRALDEPVIYQETAGRRRIVPGRLVSHGRSTGFAIAGWDHARALVIDPVIRFSKLVGGGGIEFNPVIAVDSAGAAYVGGFTTSGNFATSTALSSTLRSNTDGFIAKLNPAGTELVYATYLGGSNSETPEAIAVDATGSAWIAGSTNSPDFPTLNAHQSALANSRPDAFNVTDLFVTRLSADGSALVFSTFLGGSSQEYATAIAVDASGNACVAGFTMSSDFPTVHAFQSRYAGDGDSIVAKLSPRGELLYSTYFGGAGQDTVSAIALDASGSAYLTGITSSPDFPTRNALQPASGGSQDAFAAKLSTDGSTLIYSTYLGGAFSDAGSAIAVDGSGNAYIAGSNSIVTVERPFSALFQSTDGAGHWTASAEGLHGFPQALAVDPLHTSTVYALADGVLFKTVDGGAKWSSLRNAFAENAFTLNTYLLSLAIDPVTPSTIYAGSYYGVLKSTDSGVTWQSFEFGGFAAYLLVVDPKNPSVLYAGSAGGAELDGVFQSTDGGLSWKPTTLTGMGTGIRSLSVDPSGIVYVNSHEQLFKSTDRGAHWERLEGAPANPWFIRPDPASSATIYAVSFPTRVETSGSNRIHKSTDGGATWHDTKAPAKSVSGLVIDPKRTATLYAATEAGILKTTDGGDTWSVLASPTPTPGVLAIDPAAGSTLYVSANLRAEACVAKLNAAGSALEFVSYAGASIHPSQYAYAVDRAGFSYMAEPSGLLTRFDPSGTPVSSVDTGLPITRLAVGPNGGVYAEGMVFGLRRQFADDPLQQYRASGIFRSEDQGRNWSGGESTGDTDVFRLAVGSKGSSLLFAISGGTLLRSIDGGRTWQSSGLMRAVGSVAIDPVDNATVYAGGGDSVCKSEAFGANWRCVAVAPAVTSLAIDPRNRSIVYAATFNGIFQSRNGGESWARFTPFDRNSILTIDSQSVVYAATVVTGELWRSSDSVNWVRVNSVLGVRAMATDAVTGTLYIAAFDGLLRSRDGGLSLSSIYSNAATSFTAAGVVAVAVDPQAPSTLYIGPASGGLLRSTDAGATWQPTGLGVPAITEIAVDPTNSSRIFAATRLNYGDVFVMKIEE